MKKVLILAYDFPPYVSVGGIRPYNWYKFLPESGIHTVVVTRQWANKYRDYRDYISKSESDEVIIESDHEKTIVKTPYHPNFSNKILLKHGESKYRFIRRLISAFYEVGQFILPIGSKFQLYKAANEYLKANKVDYILATGDPFILFKYAAKLSEQYNIPWLADYRDPWIHHTTRKKNFFTNRWDSYFEKKIVSKASCITTVTKFIEDHIREVIPNANCHILPNGYDPDAVALANEVPQNQNTLSIGYAGTIADWSPIESFLNGCNSFLEMAPKAQLKLNFYGIEKGETVSDLVNQKFPRLKDVVRIYPRIPNDVLLKELSTNNLFLLFNYYSIIGTKIYDYLALKRKILFCYSNDASAEKLKEQYFHIKENHASSKHPQEDLINATNSGIIVQNEKELVLVLTEVYKELLASGKIDCNSVDVERYSRQGQARILAELIYKNK